MRAKAIIKKGVLESLRATGVLRLSANSRRRRARLLILCYHGLSLRDEHQWLDGLYITPDRFRKRLQTLKSFGANVLPLHEAVTRLQARSLPPRSVAITFDDGFYDFYRHAVPILGEFGYPCTLYLTTHYCAHRVPIFNLMLNYLLWKSGRSCLELGAYGIDKPMPIRSYGERQAVVEALLGWVERRGLDTMAKDEIARHLAAHLAIDYDELLQSRILQLMSPEQVGEASRSGVDIELHTHRHRTPRDRTLFLREIQDNTARIRDFTGREATHFCYPSGDYAPEFLPWLAESGVRSATTCELALASPESNPLLLPRFLDDSRIAQVEFESWLCGVTPFAG